MEDEFRLERVARTAGADRVGAVDGGEPGTRGGADPARQSEYFGLIVQECRRLSSLVANVLDFSRIEQGRKEYEFEPTDLIELVRETVKLMGVRAAENQVAVETEFLAAFLEKRVPCSTAMPCSRRSLTCWITRSSMRPGNP